MSNKEDRKRVKRAAEIFDRFGDLICATIAVNVGDDSEADDIFQDLFLSLVRHPVPSDLQRIDAYLYRLIVNDIIDADRRTKNYQARIRRYSELIYRPAAQEDVASDEAAIQLEEVQRMFELVIKLLQRHESKAVIASLVDCHRHAARRMGVKKRTFYRYVSTGLKKIREFVDKEEGETHDAAD
jgi:RNA polymerase sigma factor (sigma-70 family)